MKTAELDLKNKRQRKDYLNLPSDLSRKNRDWQPALPSSVAFDLSPDHPFYEHSESAFFTVTEDGKIKGRIAVLNNRNFNKHHGSAYAFFTHFACEDQPEAAALLFDAATAWAKNKALNKLIGPIGFLQTDARGLMVSGHGKLTSFSLPYSPPYYAELFNSSGFTKHSDYLSGDVSSSYQVSTRVSQAAAHLTKRSGKKIQTTRSRRRLKQIAPEVFDIYTSAGKNAAFYYPISEREKTCIIEQLVRAACPQFIHWMTDEQDQVCGLQMNLPNYAEAFRQAGNSSLARVTAFLKQRRRPKEINVSMSYLLPETQGRGFNLPLYLACIDRVMQLSTDRALVGPVHDQNNAALSIVAKLDLEFDIRHRLFQRDIS